MNEDFKEFLTIILTAISIACIVVFSMIIPATISGNWKAVASDKAQQICEQKGYDVYIDFTRVSFTDEPLAVRCNYIDNKYEINGNNDNNGVLVLND